MRANQISLLKILYENFRKWKGVGDIIEAINIVKNSVKLKIQIDIVGVEDPKQSILRN